MPTKHIVKQFDAPAFYHVYNRASGERRLFKDQDDRQYFINLLQKYLEELADDDTENEVFDIRIVAYCLMGTHFHLLLFQEADAHTISGYMKAVSVSYSMYYNYKYASKGHVFQSAHRASHISNQAYLQHISRYIHLNPRNFQAWHWSSYQDFLGQRETSWVHPELVIDNDSSAAIKKYQEFVISYSKTDKRIRESELELILDK